MTTVETYLDNLPPERRAVIEAVRAVILTNLPPGYVETMQYGMIGYAVRRELCPEGYHCDPGELLNYAALAAQKGHYSLYLMGCYGDPDTEAWLRARYAETGKKIDMGKACLRFKRLEDLPLPVIGEVIARVPAETFVERYRATRPKTRKKGG